MSTLVRREWRVDEELQPALDRLGAYLFSVGYELAQSPLGNELAFCRSTGEMTWIAMKPRQWGVTLKVNPFKDGETHRVVVDWHITSMGQLVSRLDVAYFRAEIEAAEATFNGTPSRSLVAEERHEAARRFTLRAFLSIGLLIALSAALASVDHPLLIPFLVSLVVGYAILCAFARHPGGLRTLNDFETPAE